MKPISKILALTTGLFISLNGFALEDDLQKPLQIEADKAFFDQNAGIAIYEGNVIAKQGSIHIEASYLKVTTDTTTNQFNRLDATGMPAKFSQQVDLEGNMMESHGDTILYRTTDAMLELSGTSYVKRIGDEIRADYIQYNIDAGTFRAEKQTTGRVTMTLQPQSQEGQ
jgi:lipopolysaccharide export system protein LptA